MGCVTVWPADWRGQVERDDWVIHIPQGGSPGGNVYHTAPEVQSAVNGLIRQSVDVPYGKQQTFETGCIWAFIVFGFYPFQEDHTTLRALPSPDTMAAQGYPAAFVPLLRRMLSASPDARPTLEACVKELHDMDELPRLRNAVALEPERTRREIVAAETRKEAELVSTDFIATTNYSLFKLWWMVGNGLWSLLGDG